MRGRRVRRVIRRIDPWSVLRFSAVFYLGIFAVVLVGGALLWSVAAAFGIVHNVEKFIGDLLALDHFRFRVWEILRVSVLGGLVLVVLGTGVNVVGALVYNVVADLVGGIEVSVVEDEPGSRPVV